MSSRGTTKQITDRMRRIWALHLAGISQSDIARELQITPSMVSDDIKAYLAVAPIYNDSERDTYKQRELARLETMQRSLWPQLLDDDKSTRQKAVDVLVRLSKRRSRLIGLDAPITMAPTDPTGELPYQPQDINALLTEFERKLIDIETRAHGKQTAQEPLDGE